MFGKIVLINGVELLDRDGELSPMNCVYRPSPERMTENGNIIPSVPSVPLVDYVPPTAPAWLVKRVEEISALYAPKPDGWIHPANRK